MLWWEEKMQRDKDKIQTFIDGGVREKFRGIIGLEALEVKEKTEVVKNECKRLD